MKEFWRVTRRRISGITGKLSEELGVLSDTMDNLVAAGEEDGEFAKADAMCGVFAEFLTSLKKDDFDPDVQKLLGVGYFDLGSAYRRMQRVPEAEAAYAEVLAVSERLRGVRRHRWFGAMQDAACSNHLGLLYMHSGQVDQSRMALEDAIRKRRELGRRRPKDRRNRVFLGGALCNLAHLNRDHGDVDAALSLYDESIQVLNDAIPRCDCGCQEAFAAAEALAIGHPGWVLLAHEFRRNAEAGRVELTGEEPARGEVDDSYIVVAAKAEGREPVVVVSPDRDGEKDG